MPISIKPNSRPEASSCFSIHNRERQTAQEIELVKALTEKGPADGYSVAGPNFHLLLF